MNERYEEMNRMREHVMNELDKDKDKLVSQNEFMKYTASQDFDKDEPWEVRGSHTHTKKPFTTTGKGYIFTDT
jgi:hypothetical protein